MTPAGAKGPEELRQQIERTRTQLGNTVEELAGKTDVKGRARARAADLRDKAGAMTVQLRSSAAQAGHAVQGRASKAGHTVQGKAAKAGHAVQGRVTGAGHAVRGRATEVGRTAQGRAAHAKQELSHPPGPVGNAVGFATRHPRPVLLAGAVVGAAVVGVLLVRRRHWRY
jgi:hypothetical protein